MNRNLIASELLKAAKELTAFEGQELLAKYDAVGGYSMADMSSSRGTRAQVWIEQGRDGDYAINIEGSWHNMWSNHMSGKDGKEQKDIQVRMTVRDEEVVKVSKLASIIEKEIERIARRNGEDYKPKQWTLPSKTLRSNQSGVSLKWVLSRTLKLVLAD